MKTLIISLFLFLIFLLSFFVSGNIDSQDGQLYLAVARYIYYTGEPTAPPYEFNYEGTAKNIHMGTYIGKDGKTYSPTGLGYSLALLPAVAFTDLIYKISDTPVKLEHFPLESDWLTLLSASFTNVFFGAGLGAILFLYFIELGLNKKQSLILVFISIFGTNLWVYTKHSFAHMMFICFLVLSFYSLRRYLKTNKILFLLISAISLGITTITYNQTFALAIIPLVSYYFLLSNFGFDKKSFKRVIKDLGIFVLVYLPFLGIFIWYETLRVRVFTPGWTEDFVRQYSFLFGVPLSVFIEGIYGQLFSPGRSIFLYSPILIMPLLFHHKIKQSFKPELIIFILFSVIYLVFFASLFVIEDPKYGARGLWDGELSWGPRYILVLIPFAMLVIAGIYKALTEKMRLSVFLPLVLVGVYINFLGIILPYQIKLHNLEPEMIVNGQKYTNFSYSNLLPRYTPVFAMSKELAHLVKSLPEKIDNGKFNLRFYNGIDFPFFVGGENWRVIDDKGYISFDGQDIKQIEIEINNHPLKESSSSGVLLAFYLNGQDLKKNTEIKAQESQRISLSPNRSQLKEIGNQLIIETHFKEASVSAEKTQIASIVSMAMNGESVNINSLDYPYDSQLSKELNGKEAANAWKTWDIHTQIYERTPDFWWMRPLFYWDLPGGIFLLLFLGNIIGIFYFGHKVLRLVK